MRKCPECEAEVTTYDKRCPQCKHPIKSLEMRSDVYRPPGTEYRFRMFMLKFGRAVVALSIVVLAIWAVIVLVQMELLSFLLILIHLMVMLAQWFVFAVAIEYTEEKQRRMR
jgi:hypothetical protein